MKRWALCAVALAACSGDDRLAVTVTVMGIPAQTERLHATFTLSGFVARPEQDLPRPSSGFGAKTSFVVALDPWARGRQLSIALAAFDAGGCLLGTSGGQVIGLVDRQDLPLAFFSSGTCQSVDLGQPDLGVQGCELFMPASCPAGKTCDVLNGTIGCRGFTDLGVGSPCVALEDCAAGDSCVLGGGGTGPLCRALCPVGSTCPDPDSICAQLNNQTVGVCTISCDVFRNTNCPAGSTCRMSSSPSQGEFTDCTSIGSTSQGGACAGDWECRAQAGCFQVNGFDGGAHCLQYCGGDLGCQTAGRSCVHFAPFNSGFGVCTPP